MLIKLLKITIDGDLKFVKHVLKYLQQSQPKVKRFFQNGEIAFFQLKKDTF